jgi:low affinity Fe/Cu permease
MLVKLDDLTKFGFGLQAAADELAAEVERHPEAPVALEHLRVASKIKEIDRQIEWLDNRLSQGHARRAPVPVVYENETL